MDVCIVSYKTYWGECRRMLLPSLVNILHTLKGAQLPLIDVPRASPQSFIPVTSSNQRNKATVLVWVEDVQDTSKLL